MKITFKHVDDGIKIHCMSDSFISLTKNNSLGLRSVFCNLIRQDTYSRPHRFIFGDTTYWYYERFQAISIKTSMMNINTLLHISPRSIFKKLPPNSTRSTKL